MAKLLEAVRMQATAAGLIAGTIALSVFLFTSWGSVVSAFVVSFFLGPLASPSSSAFFSEAVLLLSCVETIKHVTLANYMCFALLLMLVLLLSSVEEALVVVKESLQKKAKLPSTELLRQMNGSYERAFAVSGSAHKMKQLCDGAKRQGQM
ncbi:hypothetical protein TraAM80_02419 [Trypanosoma rangeli]|uniref:Uncharacterized protein n=1 Tax=Trypanosoma rangeli TaxID=5698 RepID=A0A3R7KLT7_TRYRA|nr:uncharacterized protein TraAM80_02419 [Trypanosoma rangeli]RNF09022.1 hypothetical protein TraAM80_02419 [Trypanosoma rangeli]|eukprot:RNF09022.1 hypothetical protein TraAM80_02419 [Trypanosoma rangeli]